MARVFLFIAVSLSVLFFIKEPEDDDDDYVDDYDDLIILLDYPIRLGSFLNLCFFFPFCNRFALILTPSPSLL